KWKNSPVERLLYSYRLDGSPWSPFSPEPTATFQDLAAGKHRVEVRAMDRNWNIERSPQFLEFDVSLPWRRDPRLIGISIGGLTIILFLAGLAVNRHLRLLRGYAEIEKIVSQRTEQLDRAHQELLHTQKMRALGTMAAGVAHDFNNILSIVKGSTQIIENNLENRDKVQTRLNRIKMVVEQGSAIVKTILGLSQATVQTRVPYEVKALLADTNKLLGDRFLSGVTVVTEAESGLPPVLGVKDLVQQILLNLLVNASEAMGGNGKIIIRAIARPAPPSGLVLAPAAASRYVLISVQDSGTGIAPDVLPRIFEPFFTTKALSTKRGTGLGLSMVYELAKEMGCGIKVTSEPGQGATFTIILPVDPLLAIGGASSEKGPSAWTRETEPVGTSD
ncbi:MAG TPA: ATP-binding protein, partial [Verrucomicrobiae bacterium]|nr:ATP-binding protein [Verrucomicrobiae bacterium]